MPTVHDQAPSAINTRGLRRRSQKRYAEAVAIFRDGIARHPREAALYNNLAVTLEEAGDPDGALEAYRNAVAIEPDLWAAQYGAGVQLMRRREYAQAEAFFERALQAEPGFVPAHLAIYELAQIRGDRATALAHQAQALRRQVVFTSTAPRPVRSVLAVMVPGDWQANVPVDFLFDRNDTTLHKLFLTAAVDERTIELPDFDVLFNCIAESDAAAQELERCATVIARARKPFINAPDAVLRTRREVLGDVLAGTGAIVPQTVRVSRAALETHAVPVQTPYLVRPVGSHAGKDLEKISAAGDLDAYLARVNEAWYYVTAFVDYASADGYFRKYRIVLVDGEPFAFHMATSDHWMVHYYNSLMAQHAWMRAEEEAFLRDFSGYGEGQRQTLRNVARALELDYVAVDCALTRDGGVLVFEADPAAIIHAGDPPELYPYKAQYVARIFRAVEAMVDRRAGSR